ncbi:YciI family protein [Kribbella sp. NPDC050281]|uniref:YciI family protein n=1 Tax=Kribbella sp. NPDC050281 TaxID=3155515 RepID=UPI0033CB3E91
MEYFVYGRDRLGGYDVKVNLNEEHWAFMDRYAEELVARGPTLTADGEETTGSLHIVDLPDDEAVHTFAYDEPYYRAGAFDSIVIHRFRKHVGSTMWDFANAVEGYNRYLVITDDEPRPLTSPHLIMYGDLLSLDAGKHLGRAALVEAPQPEAAAVLVEAPDAEVLPWEFGGRR